jgi:hypothetical protein
MLRLWFWQNAFALVAFSLSTGGIFWFIVRGTLLRLKYSLRRDVP